MVTGVVVEIIAVIIAADAYAAIPVKIIVITIIIAALIHVPEKERKLMRPDLEMAVMPPAGRIIVVANDICKKGRSVWAALSILFILFLPIINIRIFL